MSEPAPTRYRTLDRSSYNAALRERGSLTVSDVSGAIPFGDSKFTGRNWSILDTLREIASKLGCEPEQAALVWTTARPEVASILAGPRTIALLTANIIVAGISLSDDQMRWSNDASARPPASLHRSRLR